MISSHKGECDKPSASFLSTSSASAAWPEQISPLEPSKDSIGRETSGFDALGVRPREQPIATEVADVRSGDSSGRSTPIYHHYHHHFHHTQPQGRVPGIYRYRCLKVQPFHRLRKKLIKLILCQTLWE